MINFIKYIVLSIALFYLTISLSTVLSRWAFENEIFPDDYRYGDLYRLSNLPKFKEKINNCALEPKKNLPKIKIHLFIIGDSFTEPNRVNSKDFIAEKYTYIHWNNLNKIQLDTSLKNVLIMETVERGLNYHFKIKNKNVFEPKVINLENISLLNKFLAWYQNFENNLKNMEERLGLTLFSYDIFLYFKELKALFNHHVFEKKHKNYILSNNKDHIFYYEEADSSSIYSSFHPITDTEIDNFVNQINSYAMDFKKIGFNEVFLAIIPNKVSFINPDLGKYNNALIRVQNHNKLYIKHLNVYNDFLKEKEKVYYRTDTHWNCYGKTIWVNKVNNMIMNLEKEPQFLEALSAR